MIQKAGFISENGPCELCGGADCAGVALSRVRLLFGYGSRHDGEQLELSVCGSCADDLYSLILQKGDDADK